MATIQTMDEGGGEDGGPEIAGSRRERLSPTEKIEKSQNNVQYERRNKLDLLVHFRTRVDAWCVRDPGEVSSQKTCSPDGFRLRNEVGGGKKGRGNSVF